MREAVLYKNLDNNNIQCQTCCHQCIIAPNKAGICGVRKNINNKLYILNYGHVVAEQIDPIEKKPINNFLPHTYTYSFALAGCNFRCLHCQNAEISQQLTVSSQQRLPMEIIKNAIKFKCTSISYTYTEPTVFLEYALDVMKLAHKKSLKNIWVSNGYFSEKTFNLIKKYLDAINIDLKSLSNKFYQEICGAKLQPVLDNLIKVYKSGIHLEITTLIIPGKNDNVKELKQLAEFIFNKLGPEVSWHVTKFYSMHKMMNIRQANHLDILKAVAIGQKVGLKNIY